MGFIYSGAVLEKPELLRSLVAARMPIPEGWSVICHHMTTNLGRLDEGPAAHLDGQTVYLDVDAVSIDLNLQVMAVRVSKGPPTVNKTPHITVAVGPKGKAKNSNLLTNWTEIPSFNLKAQMQTVEM